MFLGILIPTIVVSLDKLKPFSFFYIFFIELIVISSSDVSCFQRNILLIVIFRVLRVLAYDEWHRYS